MGQHRITVQQIAAFESYLKREERSAGPSKTICAACVNLPHG